MCVPRLWQPKRAVSIRRFRKPRDCQRIELAYTHVHSFRLMTRQQVLDQYFIAARHQLVEIAAFLDRVDRSAGEVDYRLPAFYRALKELTKAGEGDDRAERVLLAFSDPTKEPIPVAPGKGAAGAWAGEAVERD